MCSSPWAAGLPLPAGSLVSQSARQIFDVTAITEISFVHAQTACHSYHGIRKLNGGRVLDIGETIRTLRLNKGMSQGDIENRTGLLRCYLSRVENGHTVPSLDTLAKIASALGIPIAQFFIDSSRQPEPLSSPDARFLGQIGKYAGTLGEDERRLLLAMVKKMAVRHS